jgi:hypothetical protein
VSLRMEAVKYVPADAGFQCDEVTKLRYTTKWTACSPRLFYIGYFMEMRG